ncbi:hypothetical protein BIV57_01820 [Mangrovactinospora gilvigrisea]|uniref:Adhesin domain-containing protein n=1 Tax=Mangrovactinospora gilvigrisea TaxID=1428644 RepID=A0A1J7C0L2_9ACTN|nr:hypothetical protein [Mangrovactinospora gilvigrisea]OIV39249.1 hypothetical protein BIV57_01820 [Mangrovactinospora gilvigrisea]
MRKMRAACAAGALAVGAGLLAGCSTTTDTNHKLFEFSGKELTIRTDSPVSVVPATGGQPLHVKETLKGTGKSKPDPSMSLRGDTLGLYGRCPRGTGKVELPCGATYVVALPPDVALTVRSNQQPVLVKDIRTDIDVQTSNQPITVENTAPGTSLRMVSSNGWLQGQGLRSSKVRATTSNKVVTLNFAAPPDQVRTKVSNDRATITVPRGGPDYRVTTHLDSYGKRCIEVPQNAKSDHTVDVTTTRGNARVFASTQVAAKPAWPAGAMDENMPDGCLNAAEKKVRGLK